MSLFYVSRSEAQRKLKIKLEKHKAGKLKTKKHHGKFSSYVFDKDDFLSAIRQQPKGSRINWRKLGEKFNVKNKGGKRPANEGQILFEFAKANGINTDNFNINMRISHRDYFQRLRRAKKAFERFDHALI